MKKIQLTSSKIVSNFSEPYIIAEIGANHNGDINLAKKMIDSAIDCGCHAVKFQSWQPDSIVSKEEYAKNQTYNDGDGGKKHFGSLREMVEKYYLTIEQHHELNIYCKEKKVDFCSTPFTNSETDLLSEIGVPFFKIASMDINNYNFLEHVASKKKPIIISTGMSTLGEIEVAISVINKAGNDEIVLLHCISIYPPLFEDIHLNNISMLQKTFGYPVGFSDHTIGYSIPLASVALGACIIEKHFTLDKNMPGWDHEISANPEEMKIICHESKNIVKSLGSFTRTVSKAEQEKKIKFRRSAVAKTEIEAGQILKSSDIDFKRPGSGIQPEQLNFLIGKKLKHKLEEDQLLKWSDFE
jgi:N-acetylneuraminate synthase